MKSKTDSSEMPGERETEAAREEQESLSEETVERSEEIEPTLESLQAEVEELRLKWARAQADYQNLRRRIASDHEGGVRRRLAPLLEELLLVVDYLDMALAAPTTTDEARNLHVGVEMTRQKLIQALEQEEVYPIVCEGTFDPELHEASSTRVAEGTPPGTILDTVRKGYTWREVVLRHAQVVVAGSDSEDGNTGQVEPADARKEAPAEEGDSEPEA